MALPPPREIILERAHVMSPTVRSMTFRLMDGEPFRFRAGQWVSLVLPILSDGSPGETPRGTRTIRAYSIASPPRGDATFDLAVTRVSDGPASDFLHGLAPGERLHLTGPFGTFLLHQPIQRPIAMIATGTGVAPFRSMLHELLGKGQSPVDIELIFGVRSEADILYRDEFEAWRKDNAGFRFTPTLSRPSAGWSGSTGYVQAVAEGLLVPHRPVDVYVCGVRKMVNDVRARLRSWGYDRKQVHYERYD